MHYICIIKINIYMQNIIIISQIAQQISMTPQEVIQELSFTLI